MSIIFDDKANIIKLDTKNSSYVMKILSGGILAHLYYGKKLIDTDISYLIRFKDRGFSGNPRGFEHDRGISLDTILQEYSGFNVGDYRASSICIERENGSTETDFRYVSHEIISGKYSLDALPCSFGDNCDTLKILMRDAVSAVEISLLYGVFSGSDIITRAVVVTNKSDSGVVISKVMSACADFPHKDFDLLTLPGRYAMERGVERQKLRFGKASAASIRGASSHHHNPFAALLSPSATNRSGECYGFSLVYSGNFLIEAEVSHDESTRVTVGINPEDFRWALGQGESFTAPEVIMTYTDRGINAMTQQYHRFFNEHLVNSNWKNKSRPVVINNWEATYFDFDETKLLSLAKEAADVGIDVFVLDDGWFGKRNSDKTSLGDWFVNEDKLKGGLDSLIGKINKFGMGFGIWIEPEMISEDSDLYRSHPDWCVHAENRDRSLSRSQLVLDMSRPEVVDYIYNAISEIISGHNICYVKWDFNRSLSEVSSFGRSRLRQRETWHRFVLGSYSLFDRLTKAFPEVLFEGCSGGGGRFDAGMMHYTPQIWTSDNADALERLFIQYGTALVYPLSCMSGHVSAVPNHQTQCVTSFETRGIVARGCGAFGYELDLQSLSADEKQQIKAQIKAYKQDSKTVLTGDYYSILSPYDDKDFVVWSIVASDKAGFIVAGVKLRSEAYAILRAVKLFGLDPQKSYTCKETGEVFTGDMLMNAGLNLPDIYGYAAAFEYHFCEC